MKNVTKNIFGILLIAFAMLSGLSAKAAPTCPTIKNSLSCSIVIEVQMYDCNTPTAPCGMISNTITIPPGGIFSIDCSANGTCGAWCNMKVSIVSAGPASFSPPITIAMTSVFPGAAFSVPAGPCGSGGSANFFYNPTSNQFIVQ